MKKETKKRVRHLTNYEQNVLLPILIKGLEMKKGKANAVTSKQIVEGLSSQGLKICDRVVRRIISHIRTNDLVAGLITSTVGYYITDNEKDFMNYEDILMAREKAIRKVRLSIMRQRRAMFSQHSSRQLQLF